MNARVSGGVGSLSPELVAAMTAAVQAFIEREGRRSFERRSGISAWRRSTHTGLDSGWRGWRACD